MILFSLAETGDSVQAPIDYDSGRIKAMMIEQNKRKYFKLKCLASFVCSVLIGLLAIWVCVIFWLGPSFTKSTIVNDISDFWEGPVIVDGIDFSFFHPITVDSVILENKKGKPCLEAKGVTLLFKEWPSRDIQLAGIVLDRLDLRIQFKEESADFPLKQTTASSSGQEESSDPLGSFMVDNLVIHVSNTKDASVVLDDLFFSAVSKQTGYDLSLKQRSASDSDNFSLSGDMNSEDSQINLSLGLTKDIKKSLDTGILSLLELPLPVELEGNISADIMLTGTLADIGDMQPAGTITLKDCSVLKDQKVWAEKLNTSVQVNGPRVQVEKWTADSFGGQLEGRLDAEIRQKKLAQFHGQIKGNQIQASAVLWAPTDTEKSSGGVLAFDYIFTADKGDLQQMKGQGTISLEQVDYEMIPVVQKIIRTVSLNGSKTQKKPNAIGIFEVAGPTVTFQQARLANDWVAIEALPGGTLDLQTGRIDSYVIVAPVKHLSEALHGIPVVNLFTRLTDHLTCLHVRGNRSDVSNIKITKEPLRDVGKGTLYFFQGVADRGGDFIKTMARTPGVLPKDNKK